MTVIATRRLTGRPAGPDDLGLARAIFSRAEVGRWIGRTRRPWTEARIAARAAQYAAHWPAHGFGLRYWFLGEALAGIGGLQLRVVDGRGAVELSYAFLPEHWRAGLATEAMQAALAEAPAICREVRAVTRPDNARSRRVLEKLGFRPDGAAADGSGDRLYRYEPPQAAA